MNKNKILDKTDINYIYILVYLLAITFISLSEAITNHGVVIPFVCFNVSYVLLVILLVGVVAVILYKQFSFDILLFLLLGRVILCMMPPLYSDVPSSYFGNFVESCFPFLIYVFLLNFEIDNTRISRLFITFGIIYSIQCILAFLIINLKGLASYGDPFYKAYFVIPVGATNNISAILLPLMIFGDHVISNIRLKYGYVLLLFGSIFLTKSRTGLLLAILYLGLRFFMKSDNRYRNIIRFCICVLAIIVLCMIILMPNSRLFQKISHLLMGFSSASGDINDLFSGRFSLFGRVLGFVQEHLFFGNGVSYEKLSNLHSHNVVLQILYENGLVGFMGFILFCIVSFKRILGNMHCNIYYYAFACAVPFIVVNGLVEETIFSRFIMLFGLVFLASMKQNRDREGDGSV